jgi:hypothetical protein
MKPQRKVFLGLKGAAFVVLAIVFSANCSSKNANPMPTGKGGAGGHAGTTGAGGSAGTTGAGGGAGTTGAGGGAGTTGAGGASPDGGGSDAGDAAAGCDASVSPDAGCMACATDPLFACPTLPTTCIHFDNATIPANIPRL